MPRPQKMSSGKKNILFVKVMNYSPFRVLLVKVRIF